MILTKFDYVILFLLTRLLRGVTFVIKTHFNIIQISTHTPLARRDREKRKIQKHESISTHTPLARRDTAPAFERSIFMAFLLTRLLRGVT